MARVTKDGWKKSSLRTKEIEVEELGGSVLIRELPASVSADLKGLVDMVQVGREQRAKVNVAEMERRQFAYGVITENGEQMFNDQEVAEIQATHGRAFNIVVEAIDEFSGVDKKAIEEAEARFPSGGESAPGGGDADVLGDADVAPGPDLPARAGA